MVSDSVVTRTFSEDNRVEYDTSNKFFAFEGVGCVTTWGRRNGNRIGPFLNQQRISPLTHSVEKLKGLVEHFLKHEFRPGEDEASEDVGYHVGGYDRSSAPYLHHVFWGPNRPPTSPDEKPDYHSYPHSTWPFLYNGRNDLAHMLVDKFMREVSAGRATRYDIRNLADRIRLCDFVVRFAAEMTPEVGPPIAINLIRPDNTVVQIFNKQFCPVELDDKMLAKLKGPPPTVPPPRRGRMQLTRMHMGCQQAHPTTSQPKFDSR